MSLSRSKKSIARFIMHSDLNYAISHLPIVLEALPVACMKYFLEIILEMKNADYLCLDQNIINFVDMHSYFQPTNQDGNLTAQLL